MIFTPSCSSLDFRSSPGHATTYHSLGESSASIVDGTSDRFVGVVARLSTIGHLYIVCIADTLCVDVEFRYHLARWWHHHRRRGMVVFISIILVGIPSMIQADLKLWSRDSTFQDFLHRCVPHNSVCRIRKARKLTSYNGCTA